VFLCGIFLLRDFVVRRETRRKEEMLHSKRRFVRFISHEIRTPLNSVHLGIELLIVELKNQVALLDGNSLPVPQVIENIRASVCSWLELTADLMGNSESAVDVLNDLLNYDKIEMGTMRLDFTAVSIWPLVEKCTRTFTMQAKQKEICLDIHGAMWDKAVLMATEYVDVRSLVVIGDSNRIAQIMRNLLSNALKFTPTSGTVTVTGKSVIQHRF
jgi:two-component system cell cycle sensor histidine kinase PleC